MKYKRDNLGCTSSVQGLSLSPAPASSWQKEGAVGSLAMLQLQMGRECQSSGSLTPVTSSAPHCCTSPAASRR